MRKVILNFAIAVKVILSVSQLAYGGERPASAPPIDERLTGIESRVNGHDTEIAELSRKIDALKLAIRCPCPRGGECICPAGECLCPNCPKHSKAAKTETAKESYPIAWRPGLPTYTGREYLYFGASWCHNCPPAEKRLGNLISQIFYIDCTTSNPIAQKYGVSSLPTALLLVDGKIKSQCSGNDVNQLIVGDWLKGMEFVESGRSTAGVGANLVGGKPSAPAATSRATYSAPRMTVTRGNGPGHTHRCSYCGTSWSHENWNVGSPSAHTCPNCRRITYGNRTEGWNAPYKTRSQPASYQFQPRVQFATGYSYGTCPNCPR